MTLSLDEILIRARIDRAQLVYWVEQGWVAPARNDAEAEWAFEEIDAARVNFISELMRDMMIGEEAVPVVLSLVDQLNALRGTLKQVLLAVEEMPEPARGRIIDILKDIDDR